MKNWKNKNMGKLVTYEETSESNYWKEISKNDSSYNSYKMNCLLELEQNGIKWAEIIWIYERDEEDRTIVFFEYITSKSDYPFIKSFPIFPVSKKVNKIISK